ncbi:MAG: NAD(P)/FAD-dependent oxidoreductase [Candidatus Izemoplasmatales bacterium]
MLKTFFYSFLIYWKGTDKLYDYIIIGAGVIGSNIARELCRYQTKVLVLDKENDVANVQSLANSAIVHSGHNPEPGSLKARLSVWGNLLYEQMEEELGIPLLKTGAYVVAHNHHEEQELEKLAELAKINQVPEFSILNYEEALLDEPNLSKTVTKVLSLPTTKVTYPWEVAFAAMENAIKNGVEFQKNALVTKIRKVGNVFYVTVNNNQEYQSKYIINAAGVASDDVAGMIEKKVPYTIKGRKGEYFVLDKRVKGFVNHVLYPLPTELGKGVLITPQFHGEILLGPNSLEVKDKYHPTTSYEGLTYVKENAALLADNIPINQIIRSFAGIRSTSDYDDFYIKESLEVKGFYHLGGIDSPGLTACFAIAKYLVEEVMNVGEIYSINPNFDPLRKKKVLFNRLSLTEKKALLNEDPLYGNIICKCEKITEKEILDAMHGPLGSNTIKGIKKRTRAGAGLCQGGYCEEKIIKMIAKEFNISPLEIAYDNEETKLFVAETKVKL